MGYRGRDIEVAQINSEQYLVAACDSCGAIGLKEFDVVKVPWAITGRFTTRVALLEVLTTGAIPKLITAAISNEPQPVGEEIIKGVKEELEFSGLKLPLAISTEKNMTTQQTGLGISVIGVAEKSHMRIGTSQPGDWIFCIGIPKVGNEISDPEDCEIVNVKHIKALLEISDIHDIIPVGSKGILGEVQILASSLNSHFKSNSPGKLDLQKSAGPSTCLIFSAGSEKSSQEVSEFIEQISVVNIGRLE